MDDLNNLPEISGAGGGSSQPQQTVVQNVTVTAPTRQPVEEANNLFSVAFAKTVYAISEGEIEGFPTSAEKDIFLDSTPIQNPDGTFNFTGYTIDNRTGTDETQTPMSGFSTAENTVGVNTAVTTAIGPITRTITDLDTERCRVIINHPALQSTNVDNGDIQSTSVRYQISVSANGGPYNVVTDQTVSGKSNSQFQRAYEFDLIGTGPWSIRVTRITADSTSAYLQNGIQWQSYTEIIDEKFDYPNTSLVGVKVDARQFNSIPNVSVRVRGKRVQIPTNYNPVTRAYSGIWDGTFTTAWTDNPAWIFRDIVLNPRFGCARYMPTIAVDPWYLYTVSQYCDELVPDGNGFFEPRFTCNVYLQNPGGVYEVLNALASCFRGLIYYSQGKLYLTQDRAQLPVQQFSEANVIQEVDDSGNVTAPCFTYTGTAKTARKSVVLANWDDPNQIYSSVTEYLQDDELLERFGYNPIDLRLVGVTSRGQALRAAKHTLFSNRYETEKVSFRIGAEGLAASVGEVIQIADPLKQGQRLGGRVRSIDQVDNIVTLDATLNLDPANTYTLTLVIPDGETVTNPDGSVVTTPKLQVLNVEDYSTDADGYTTIELNGVIDTQENALWVLEWQNLEAAQYKIIAISEVDPLVFQVEAIQYNNSKFGYVDNDLPVAIPKDRFTLTSANAPTGLTAELVFRNNQTQISAYWTAPQTNNSIDLLIRGYRYQWRQVGDTEWADITQISATNVSQTVDNHVFGDAYEFRVAAVDRLGRQSEFVVASVAGFEAIPDLSDPDFNSVIRHQNQPDGTQLLIVNAGTCPIPERVTGYRCWAFPTNVPTVIPGVKEPEADGWYFLSDIPLTGYYTIAFHAPGEWEIRVAFTSAIFGENPTNYIYDTVKRDEIVPPRPNNFTVVENTSSGLKRFSWQLPLSEYGSWDQGVVSDVVSYEIKYRQGSLQDVTPAQAWDLGIDLYSGGVSANQQWFETGLFDTDTWTVMVKSVDATQWRSDDPAVILVNIGTPLPNNVVYDECINSTTWPGSYINAEITDNFTLVTQDNIILTTQSGAFITGDTGVPALQQIDPTEDSYFTWNFDNNFLQSSLLIATAAQATYQHSIAALTGAETSLQTVTGLEDVFLVTQSLDQLITQSGDEFFVPALTAAGAYDILQEDDDFIYTEQRTYTEAELSGSAAGVLHPYAPYEQLTEDVYAVRTLFRSVDGLTPGALTSICFELDYPDVIESQNDVAISSSGAGTAIPLAKTFRVVKAVQVTLQDTGTGAINAIVLSKTTSSVTVKCVNSSGTAVAGLIDITVVGY